jgi:prepilin-type N-terminal cleavage/methylation domain-containing protein
MVFRNKKSKIKILKNLETTFPHSKFHIPNSRKGFTLIELIVVLFMMAMLSTIMLANFRAGQRQRSVQLAADTLVNAFRTAQSYTLSGKKIGNCAPKYYYVTLTYSTAYTLFALDSCGGTDTIQTYNLPVNVKFRSGQIKVEGASASANAKIYFTPPFAKITASRDGGAAAAIAQATFILESSDGSVSKTVTVDGVSGKVE